MEGSSNLHNEQSQSHGIIVDDNDDANADHSQGLVLQTDIDDDGGDDVYNENPNPYLVFHSGGGYQFHQPPYGPFSPLPTSSSPYYPQSDLALHAFYPSGLFDESFYATDFFTSPHGMGSHQQNYAYDNTVYYQGDMYSQPSNYGGNNASLCSCRHGRPEFLSEQNRGPRATRPRNARTEQSSSVDSNGNSLYNDPNFCIEYEDAKFFVIKSYSEDNVHKSVKYGVWASTTNGNRKLDCAYNEAIQKENPCPVFLFFSVNASSQFIGVAEMIGPVDFEKNVDYWQHDKWNGQFPVKWHIIKDVPNNQFRHIILENNDHKPVTNSRDTQEVKLEQGVEMLSIFKRHESVTSILDDFDFYEDRQRAMQESKALQQHYDSDVINNNALHSGLVPDDVINHISENFDCTMRLEEGKTDSVTTAETEARELENSVISRVTRDN